MKLCYLFKAGYTFNDGSLDGGPNGFTAYVCRGKYAKLVNELKERKNNTFTFERQHTLLK